MTLWFDGLSSTLARTGASARRIMSGASPEAAQRVLTGEEESPLTQRVPYYELLEAYYESTVFKDAAGGPLWGSYKAKNLLPRNTRILFNCVARAVDWYPGALYGERNPNTRHLVPWSEDSEAAFPTAIEAAEQSLAWGNWRSEQYAWVRGGALRGVSLVEIVDDQERQKVYPRLIHPGMVTALELDASGNVTRYRLAQRNTDESGNSYVWAREIDKEKIMTFKDGEPFDYDGYGAVRENPYTFVPAVWVRHRHAGGLFGVPVIGPTIEKLEALNAAGSSAFYYILRFAEQGAIMSTNDPGAIKTIGKGGATSDLSDPYASRESIRLLTGPADLSMHKLLSDLGLEHGLRFLDLLVEEIENDLPELTVDKRLQEMTQLTGPGAERALGEVAKRYREAEGNYDAGLVKICQMCVAVGGWRLQTGDWGDGMTPAQRKFLNFDLSSFAKGELDFETAQRSVVPMTESEKVALVMQKEMVKTERGLIELYGLVEGRRIFAEQERRAAEKAEQMAQQFNAGGGSPF